MGACGRLPLLLLQLLGCASLGAACFCDRYAWGSWSACSRTCNHGTQQRRRNFQYDDYYWKSSCRQLCQESDSRACNQQACPINCQLTQFGPWSDCSPCAAKQLRTRAVQRPAQFGGTACSEVLMEERPCHPSTQCRLPPTDCRGEFQCDNGRCINSTLTCNRQNDCEDNSDERDCTEFTIVCPADKRVVPGADLVGNGFDVLAEEPRGAVLDNMFMGGTCNLKRPRGIHLSHRIPHNFHSFDIKVGQLEDFSTQPRPLRAESITVGSSSSSSPGGDSDSQFFFFPFPFVWHGSHRTSVTSNKAAFTASKTRDSKFFRVHQVLPVSTFKVREPGELMLSGPFLQFLHALPLEYNYALYRDIFQRFGTHYYSSGTLGGHYDLLYQYDRKEITSSGETEERVRGCLSRETTWTIILYTEHSSENRCHDNRMTERYQGSMIQAAEKSFSEVKGGRAREAAALAWERQGPAPDRTSYRNWAKSVLDNPAVVEYKLLPIIDLVRGIPCAVTKRRHLRKALRQYLDEFDTCRCAPCPNNARPLLSGTECKCVCQTGTFGENCEKRAPDYTSEQVDGYWSCWGPWSRCGASMRRHRTRRCDNPAPLRGGRSCQGPARDEDPCHISLFVSEETCDNDDDYTVGWRDELPPGVEGCTRPKAPANSFLRKAKQYYSFGEDEEFTCVTGFDLDGFQYISCRPDGSWSPPQGSCIRKVCLPPELPDGLTPFPKREEYRMGDTVGLNCEEAGLMPLPPGSYSCGTSLTWEPPIPAELRCSNERPFQPEGQCGPGQRLQGTACECLPRERCLSQPETLCVLNVDVGAAVPMSPCAFHVGRCHGDPLSFITKGSCDAVDAAKLEWAKFRAKMGPSSSVQEPCQLDTCYEWERCAASERCECRAARDCPRADGPKYCVKLTRSQRTRTMDLCSMAALSCANYQMDILNQGDCPAT